MEYSLLYSFFARLFLSEGSQPEALGYGCLTDLPYIY